MDPQSTTTSSYTLSDLNHVQDATSSDLARGTVGGALDYWVMATGIFAAHLVTTVLLPPALFRHAPLATAALAVASATYLWAAVQYWKYRRANQPLSAARVATFARRAAVRPDARGRGYALSASLFLLFPLCVGVGADEVGEQQTALLTQTLLSLAGYITCLTGAINAWRTSEENVRALQVHHRAVMPLDAGVEAAAPPGHRNTRAAFVMLGSGGALALATFSPLIGGSAFFEQGHGDAAHGAQMMTAVVAGCLAVAVPAYFVGPALRASRSPSAKSHARRARSFMGLAALGALALLLHAWYR